MAQPLRTEYPGAVYHVTSRGNAKADIFLTDDDRQQVALTIITRQSVSSGPEKSDISRPDPRKVSISHSLIARHQQ
jgi:hypothetical protein